MIFHLVMQGLGYAFLAVGIVGIVAPILPGWILIFVGLIILGKYAAWAKRTLSWFKDRHPRLRAVIQRAEAVATRWTRLVRVRLGRWMRPVTR